VSLWKKLREPRILRRVLLERLTEPLHLNLLALGVAAFGSLRQRVNFDLLMRQHNAYSILSAAERAIYYGHTSITIIEFGVAAGAGLINMCQLAQRVSKATGVEIKVIGFDSGTGMPPPLDFRDHPEYYQEGDFPMNHEALRAKLPSNGELILGQLQDTIAQFRDHRLNVSAPIAYVVIDVDYYSSTVDALKIFDGPAEAYLPLTLLYLDDVGLEHHNRFAGEELALREFNDAHPRRKAVRHDFLESGRIFRRAPWLKHMHFMHIMDHPIRSYGVNRAASIVLQNPHL
jgi:hypothetical protein